MIFIVWITDDIHVDFNDIHWEGCLHITRRSRISLLIVMINDVKDTGLITNNIIVAKLWKVMGQSYI